MDKILNESNLGQKTFVYPIKKEKSGFYTSFLFEMEAEKVQDFTRKLALEEEIMRHLIITIKPTQEMVKLSLSDMPVGKTMEIAKEIQEIVKPEQEVIVEEEKAIEIPKQAIIEEPEKEIAVEEKPVKAEKVVKAKKEKVKVEKPKAEKPKTEKTEVKKPAKPEIESTTEEERLEALDKKLEELLKD